MKWKRTILSLLCILCLAITSVSQTSGAWIVREDGVGPVKIGMTLAQLSAALHQELGPDEKDEHGCFYIDAHGHDHIGFMIVDGKVVRVDVGATGVKTSAGIQVGDSEAYARQVYGPRMKVTAHAYIDDGHYLTVRSPSGRYGVRFETEKGKIVGFYAGTYEAIQYVEGCE
jgi:hypothetical protein